MHPGEAVLARSSILRDAFPTAIQAGSSNHGVFVEGQLADVLSGTIYPARIHMEGGVITRIERQESAPQQYLLPGLIDAHVHIESSHLTPYRFAEMAVVHGTTAVVTDPHEIANVAGMDGIEFMVRDGRGTPLRFYFTAPSCVPSTPFESSGATLDQEAVKRLLQRDDFVALGEVMDFTGAIRGDPDILAKLEISRQAGKPVDGHCPGLEGEMLDQYIDLGISTEHECTELGEALEKHLKGMIIMVREGSASRDLTALLPLARISMHFLVTDDLQASDLVKGHVNVLLRKSVEGGVDPIHALRAVTLWPAEHYGLPGGALQVGEVADIVIVNDLREFKVLETWIGGELVARNGKPLFKGMPLTMAHFMPPKVLEKEGLEMRGQGNRATVRVIEVLPNHIISRARTAKLPVRDGKIIPDPSRDILKLVVINRYADTKPSLAFIKGFGLRSGALASSVAHDAHNLIAVGVDDLSLTAAINGLCEQGGGFLAIDGETSERLQLPVAGLMSTRPCVEVARQMEKVDAFVRAMGCSLPAPFITLSFQSLLVVPELKLGARGLFDSVKMRFVEPVIRPQKE